MRFLGQFFLSVIGLLGLACLLSYPVFELIVPYAPHLRFDRLATRIFQALIILTLILLVKRHHLNQRASFGLSVSRATLIQQQWRGFCVGVLSLLPVVLCMDWFHLRTWQTIESSGSLVKILLSSVITGFVVAWFEESIFRGLLQGVCRSLFKSPWPTLALVGLFFASVHFLSRTAIPAEAVTPTSGWVLWQSLYVAFLTPSAIVDAFCALWLVSVFLGWLRERSGSIGLSIGAHAGWVSVIKCTVTLSVLNPQADYAFLLNPADGFVGWLVALWSLSLVGLLMYEPAMLARWLYPERYSPDP
jgi:membrane protease YdiL (CAAX protease family)